MKKPCKHPGCNALLDKSGYCESHAKSAPKRGANYDAMRKRDPKQAAIDSFRNTAAWQNVRRLKLSMNPLCEDPFSDHQRRNMTESARQVHHVKPLATHPELGLSMENLMSVCYTCHARIENQSSE